MGGFRGIQVYMDIYLSMIKLCFTYKKMHPIIKALLSDI